MQKDAEPFADFCAVSARLGRPVTQVVRGHDHPEDRYAVYPAYQAHPVLTTVARSRRLNREQFATHERVPTLARVVEASLPQVYRLDVSPTLVNELFPPPALADAGVAPANGDAQP